MSLRDKNTHERINALFDYLSAEGLDPLEIASLCAVACGAIISDAHNRGFMTPAQRDDAIRGGQRSLREVGVSAPCKMN